MSIVDIHLPETLKSYLDEQIARRGYKDASEFMGALLEADRVKQVGADLESMLLEAADGPFTGWTDEDVAAIGRLGERLIERRRPR